MTLEEKKSLVAMYYDELFNQRNLAVVDDYLADSYICHEDSGPGFDKINRNPEEVKDMVRMYFSAFPDLKTTFDEITADGDRIVTRWTTQGTQHGSFMGFEPTRRQATVSGTCIDRVIDGKIVESWVKWDANDLLRQLGIEKRKAA